MGWLGLEIVGNDLEMRLEWKPISSESEGSNMDMPSTQRPKETIGNGVDSEFIDRAASDNRQCTRLVCVMCRA